MKQLNLPLESGWLKVPKDTVGKVPLFIMGPIGKIGKWIWVKRDSPEHLEYLRRHKLGID